MTLAPVEERYNEYEHWLVLNAADQIVTVGKLLEQQVRTLEYLTPELRRQPRRVRTGPDRDSAERLAEPGRLVESRRAASE